jgi:hypothetical protein
MNLTSDRSVALMELGIDEGALRFAHIISGSSSRSTKGARQIKHSQSSITETTP